VTYTVRAGRNLGYALVLIPLSLLALVGTLGGQGRRVASWWFRLLGQRPGPIPGRLPFARVAGHALLSVGLAAAAVVLWGIDVLFVLRGVFYGFVDHGPYNTSWGGPTRGGAWLAHFLISFPCAIAAAVLLAGIAMVHRRLTVALSDSRPAPWLIPVALLIPVPAVLFFIAWLHQI
jgi:hypothetical protein